MNIRAMRAPHAIPSRMAAAKYSFILEPGSYRLVRLLLAGVVVVSIATTAAAFISPVGTFNPSFKANIAVERTAALRVTPSSSSKQLADTLTVAAASSLPAPANLDDARPIVGPDTAGTVRVNNLA
ncbi:MAG: hypothetical protein K2W95_19600 [Candidatus Obscuribacterales bacterium]|nr:hypothetical protein [Candidatus Obscuribacterales bacterium]